MKSAYIKPRTLHLILLICFLLTSCVNADKKVKVDIVHGAFDQLSAYHFFKGNMNALEPNDRVLPYDLITPLFTDYAFKSRFVWMPEGASANYRTEDALDFPTGTVLIKNFYYPTDFRKSEEYRRIVETRILMKRTKGWEAFPYVWNEAQTEATLEITGAVSKESWLDDSGNEMGTTYVVPNKNQCKGCHELSKELKPIGPKVRNLNRTFPYSEGTKNQLEKWAEVGYLQGYEEDAAHPAVADWENANASLQDRAVAYLDVNCGHCHNPRGPGGVSGLNLTWDAPINANFGLCKAPVAAGDGSGGKEYDIVPGNPDESIFIYRMLSTDPGRMMPELGRTMVHEEGVKLIRDWIASLDPDACNQEFD